MAWKGREEQVRLWRENRAKMLGSRPETWPPERLAELRRLGALSLPLSEIANRMGLSKGAVQGKMSRLGIARRPPRGSGPPRPKTTKVLKFREAAKPRATRMPIPDMPLSPTAKCQFIEGEPSADDACKCNKPAIVDKPYCHEHHARCYVPYVLKDRAEAA